MQANSQTEGYLVDYHDFARNESAAALSLVYVDISALREMHNNGILSLQDYERYQDLLAHMPSDGIFYPKTYQISSGQYEYDASVNLIDQLIVGIHLAEMNHPPKDLIAFLKENSVSISSWQAAIPVKAANRTRITSRLPFTAWPSFWRCKPMTSHGAAAA